MPRHSQDLYTGSTYWNRFLKPLRLARLLSFLLLLAALPPACGNPGTASYSAESPAPETKELTITFAAVPQTIEANQTARLTVKITRGNIPVKDASVGFEIWRQDEPDGEHLQQAAEPDNKGSYSLKGSFTDKGAYSIVIHVTTAETHEMKMESFEVH
ncbi:FixH family protein [Paenibacillus sp. FJAT-26967]|uniref:FixH family protein n=1 Tax=Paenibacillus sp. FJAT-26967 TaxID=1729690 RepID=UPI000AC4DF77|nr:FixH family protein [Paenibacillus sp. FJAT-26967]